jgi:hypothetical protein
MSGERGGPRPGSGRPKGAKTRVRAEAKERLRRLLDPREATIVKRLLNSKDERVQMEMLRLCWMYTDGRPKEEIAVRHGVDLQGYLEAAALRRLGSAGEAVHPPSARALPPAGGPASIAAEAPAAEPAEAGNGLPTRGGGEPDQQLSRRGPMKGSEF